MAKLHVAGFFEDQDGAGVLQPLAALVDTVAGQVLPTEATDFLLTDPRLPMIIGAHAAIDATVQPRCRLVAPSFRRRYGSEAVELPILSSTTEPASPHAYNDLRQCPIRLNSDGKTERLSAESLNNPAAAANQFVICVFADGVPAPIVNLDGFVWRRFTTAAAALTADAWNNRALVSADVLEPGVYEVAGGYAISTSAIAARLAFLGTDLRPPIGAKDTRTDTIHPFFQPGQLGILGEFSERNLPSVDILADAADNEVQVVDLLCRRKGAAGAR